MKGIVCVLKGANFLIFSFERGKQGETGGNKKEKKKGKVRKQERKRGEGEKWGEGKKAGKQPKHCWTLAGLSALLLSVHRGELKIASMGRKEVGKGGRLLL